MQARLVLPKIKETAEVYGHQRKRKVPGPSLRGDPNRPQRKVLRKTGQLDDRIRSLVSEIQALKGENRSLRSENEALNLKCLKKHACQICTKSYSRSDGLYKHMWEGDNDHKAFAQERYGTRCGSCETDFKSWVGLQRHMISRHGQDALKSADDLKSLKSDGTSTSPNPSTTMSEAEGRTSSATSLYGTEYGTSPRRTLDFWFDAPVQSTEDATTIFSPSTPSRAITRANSLIASGESPGLSDNPVYPLNSAAPRQMISSLYDVTIKEAPSFATNPAYPPNYVASGQTLYNTSTAEAPSFIASPAYPLNYASTHSLYNAVDEEAPTLSNKALSSAHPSLCNTASWGTPVFSVHRDHP